MTTEPESLFAPRVVLQRGVYVHISELDDAEDQLERLREERRCNAANPGGSGKPCDHWPGHDGKHANAESEEWSK